MLTVICLVHNAPSFALKFMESFLAHPPGCEHELLVLDNASDEPARAVLAAYKDLPGVRLFRSSKNLMFSGGVNFLFPNRSESSDATLLVNSDVELLDDRWLDPLVSAGCSVAGYGLLQSPNRPDGWCMLVETELMAKYGMDEDFPFWQSTTKLVSDVLDGGGTACALTNYDDLIFHEGKASGPTIRACQPRRHADLSSWFRGKDVRVVDSMSIL